MVDKNSILIMYYRDGESKSSISRQLKISRKTVRKYIEEHEQKTNSSQVFKHLEKGLSSRPEYNVSSREKVKLTCVDRRRNKVLHRTK